MTPQERARFIAEALRRQLGLLVTPAGDMDALHRQSTDDTTSTNGSTSSRHSSRTRN